MSPSGSRNVDFPTGVLGSVTRRIRERAMVTNYPQQLAATSELPGTTATDASAFGRAMAFLGQALCGFRGHDSVLHFEGKRVMMRCTSCGHDTPGWEINEKGPRKRFDGDARRHHIKRQRLVLRKTA